MARTEGLMLHYIDDATGECVATNKIFHSSRGPEEIHAEVIARAKDEQGHTVVVVPFEEVPDMKKGGMKRRPHAEGKTHEFAQKHPHHVCKAHVPTPREQELKTKSDRYNALREKGWAKQIEAERDEARVLAYELGIAGPPPVTT